MVAENAVERGLRLCLDRDSWLTQMTTLGAVSVPLFPYRDEAGDGSLPGATHGVPTASSVPFLRVLPTGVADVVDGRNRR
jgi:hypothetical protein